MYESNKLKIKELQDEFRDETIFGLKDIVEFYKKFEKAVKKTTVNWRVHTLVQKGILQRVSRTFYVLGKEKNYIPEISSKIKSIYKKTKKEFPYLAVCIWNTKWLNEFMIHQPNRFYILLEVEKDVAESVFYYLREKDSAVFLEPKKDVFEKYLPENKEAIIVKSLVSEAPVISAGGIETASIEKILVDIFCDGVIFSAYQGSEMLRIFESAFTKYTVNQSKMFRYANRRGKKDELVRFTTSIIQTQYQ